MRKLPRGRAGVDPVGEGLGRATIADGGLALSGAIRIEAFCVPSIFSKNTSPPDGSTMAIAIFQLCFFISPSAASATCFAWSGPIGSP